MKRKKRWSVSLKEEHYWKLRKISEKLGQSYSSILAEQIDKLAQAQGIENPTDDQLKELKPAKTKPTFQEITSAYFTF